jgi:UDPglucose 6-dehydrogenase
MAQVKGRHPQLLAAVMDINDDRRRLLVDKVRSSLGDVAGKQVGLLGLTFKPNTDDLREAPALDIAEQLLEAGAELHAFDPVGMQHARVLMPQIQMADDPYDLAEGMDALVVCTEWNEFAHLDLERIHGLMKNPVVVDGRNIYDPTQMRELGFTYLAIGRGYDANGDPVAN